jgi:hypothetical protein
MDIADGFEVGEQFVDRRRKKRMSKDWANVSDPDAKIMR